MKHPCNPDAKKDVLLLLTDRWADWEASYAVARLHASAQYRVTTISTDRKPRVSVGGVRAEIDHVLGEYTQFQNLAMLIIPGSYSLRERPCDEIAAFVRQIRLHQVPVAAICGGAIFLGRHGFLDHVRHTGDELESFLILKGYAGEQHHEWAQVVAEQDFITANETAAVAFAAAILHRLGAGSADEIAAWQSRHQYGAAW